MQHTLPDSLAPLYSLDWTPFERWTDNSAEVIKDELLRIIVANNPTLPIVNPDWN